MNTQIIPEHIVAITAAPLNVYALDDANKPILLCRYGCDTRTADNLPREIAEFLEQSILVSHPSIACVYGLHYYAVIPAVKKVYLLGPVRLSASLSLKHNFKAEDSVQEADSNPALCDIPVFLSAILLLNNLFSANTMTVQKLLSLNRADNAYQDVQKYNTALVFDNRENSQKHNSYSQELRLLGSIEQGDLEMLEKCQQEKIIGSFGKLSQNMDRSIRNVCIAAITLSSRVAIRGGVNAEIAFSLCDSYIMKLEALKNLKDVQLLVESAQRDFASMVKRRKDVNTLRQSQFRHPIIEKCKNYIHAHLHDKITVNEAAHRLNTNPNYLSTLFKQHEGITFTDYVMNEKIALAKSLLIYSRASYSDIAATLGFSSQSHMGKHFKAITGMTPIQFRRRYSTTELND